MFPWLLQAGEIELVEAPTATPFSGPFAFSRVYQSGKWENSLKFTPTKRRLTTSHLPTLEPLLKPALSSYTINSSSLPLPSLTFFGLPPPSPNSARFCDTRIFSYYQ